MANKSNCRAITTALLSFTFLLDPAVAVSQSAPDAGEKAVSTRQGFMQLVVYSAGPLFGMAKGDVAYDAAVANSNAENLKALAQYDFPALFVDGTSKEDRPGKTRALPEIWADKVKFEQTFGQFGDAVNALSDQAGTGQAELAAAVGNLGKACGDCHNAFRAKDF